MPGQSDIKERRKKVVEALVSGEATSGSEAARIGGYNSGRRKSGGLTPPSAASFRAELLAALSSKGIGPRALAVRSKRGLDATKPITNRQGQIVGDWPDWAARHRYLETVLKLAGALERDAGAPEDSIELRVIRRGSPIIDVTPQGE